MGVVAFRADASLDIGTGHIMRCLTLANALRARGERCLFICREHPGNLIELIIDAGFETLTLPAAAAEAAGKSYKDWLGVSLQADVELSGNALQRLVVDWLVVDHYAIDANWEGAMRPHCKRLIVIDDLADRPHDCDLLLNQNIVHTEEDYAGLVPKDCRLLVGTEYTMLRPEFAQMREYSLKRRADPSLDHILITMGGVDQNNATGQVLEALEASTLPANSRITVIMGPHAPWLKEIKRIATTMPWEVDVKVGVNNMEKLMADSDLAIGAAGSTAWELCCLGLPSLIFVLAENQIKVAHTLANMAAMLLLLKNSDLPAIIDNILSDELSLATLSDNSSKIVDGRGTERVVQEIFK